MKPQYKTPDKLDVKIHDSYLISPLDEMAAILADDIFKRIFLNENDRIPIPGVQSTIN